MPLEASDSIYKSKMLLVSIILYYYHRLYVILRLSSLPIHPSCLILCPSSLKVECLIYVL